MFQSLVAAQLRAWREIADRITGAASEFAAAPRGEMEAAAIRLKADAAAAEEKMKKVAQAGTEPWSMLSAGLAETRAAFDRATQMTQDSFNQVMRMQK